MSRSDDGNQPRDLTHLPRSVAPDPVLEDRVVAALRSRGLVQSGRPTLARWLFAAALLLAVATGWIARGVSDPSQREPPAGEIYVLLLAEPRPLLTDKPLSLLVEEYSSWAADLAKQDRLVAAAHLGDESRRLVGSGTGEIAETAIDDLGQVTGYFAVRAAGWTEALELAKSSPHLGYGGEISVRAIR